MASKLKLTELLYPTSTTAAITINSDDSVTIPTQSTTNLAYTGTLTGGTGVVNIGSGQVYKDASGNVGIGVSNPASILSVQKYNAAGLGPELILNNNANSISDAMALTFASGTIGSGARGRIQVTVENNPFYGAMQFFTGASNATLTERVRITGDGNVGIGTSSPLAKLQVYPTVGAPASSGNLNTGVIFAEGAGGPSLNMGNFNSGGTYYAWIQSAFVNNAAVVQPLVLQQIGGNVGIGTVSPTAKLHVAGSLFQTLDWAVIGAYNANATYPTSTDIGAAIAWNFTAGGREVIMMNNDFLGDGVRFVQRTNTSTSNFVGSGGSNGAWKQGNNSAAWTVVSDIRIKQNIRPLNESLAKITALNPCHFEYKNKPNKIKTGFIAQEFEKVLPGHVQEAKPDVLFAQYFEEGEKLKSIDVDLIPYLVGAIKEQQALIANLTTRLTALEGN